MWPETSIPCTTGERLLLPARYEGHVSNVTATKVSATKVSATKVSATKEVDPSRPTRHLGKGPIGRKKLDDDGPEGPSWLHEDGPDGSSWLRGGAR